MRPNISKVDGRRGFYGVSQRFIIVAGPSLALLMVVVQNTFSATAPKA